ISSAIANIESNGKLGKILGVMTSVFVVTIALAAVLTILGLWAFPVTAIKDASAISEAISTNPEDSWGDKILRFVSVGEFVNLLSRQNILAFVIFSFLIGISVRKSGEVGKPFLNFLLAGNEVMQNLLTIIMKLGPIGLGAYFAYQVQTLGPELFGFYAKPLAFYYIFGTVFFFIIYSLYAFIGNGKSGI